MKIVVIGGTGLIGTKLASKLRQNGHEVIQAAPSTGVNTITGEGLDRVLSGAEVVVDVANSPSFEDRAALTFFEASGHNLLAAETTAKVRHHVALSVVGTDRLPECGYFRAKLAQENLIRRSAIPHTILRATQFFEFVGGIVDASSDGPIARLSPALFQPVASDDVAAALADVALADPVNGMIELAGPERLSLDEFGRKYLAATGDPRKVVADIHGRYFGAELDDRSLTPGDDPRLGAIRFEDWLAGLRT
ncbi:MAG: SDR family oxidoreductase [Bradyrhizobium sp.]